MDLNWDIGDTNKGKQGSQNTNFILFVFVDFCHLVNAMFARTLGRGSKKPYFQSTSKKKVLDSTPPGMVVEAVMNVTMPGWCHTNRVFGVLSVELTN